MELSHRQRELWRLMTEDDRRTVRELRDATNASSTSVVNYNLHRLVDLGVLQPPRPGRARDWRLLVPFEES